MQDKLIHIQALNDMSDIEWRFWMKVDTSGDCWLWKGALNTSGYGMAFFNGKTHAATRFAYEFINGPIPAGLLVMHSCDNPGCVNPAHLSLGTHQENTDDRVAKGRNVNSGYGRGRAKFTPAQRAQIRADRKAGATFGQMMKRYDTRINTILKILREAE